MIYQWGQCLSERLAESGIPNATIHLDVWRNMNMRFEQRAMRSNFNAAQLGACRAASTPPRLPDVTRPGRTALTVAALPLCSGSLLPWPR